VSTIFRPSSDVVSFMDVSAMIELKPLPPHPKLTHRQNEVLSLLSLGYYNDQIADALHITPKTVRCYVQRIAQRLDLVDVQPIRARRLLRVLVVRKATEDLLRAS
jgi:DNA-binding NarL/FixJ family response regulator